jgi:hypothetical protein
MQKYTSALFEYPSAFDQGFFHEKQVIIERSPAIFKAVQSRVVSRAKRMFFLSEERRIEIDKLDAFIAYRRQYIQTIAMQDAHRFFLSFLALTI